MATTNALGATKCWGGSILAGDLAKYFQMLLEVVMKWEEPSKTEQMYYYPIVYIFGNICYFLVWNTTLEQNIP